MGQHPATAARALDNRELVDAVMEDWRSAPIEGRLKATFAFIEKLILTPGDVTAGDAQAVRKSGVSLEALEDAIHVAINFVMINKLADAFDWEILDDDVYDVRAGIALERGYVIPPSALE